MKAMLILCSAAIMAVIVPATLFAQTTPVQPAAAAPVVKTVEATAPVAAFPTSVTVAPAKATTAPVRRTVSKAAAVRHGTAKKASTKTTTAKVVAKSSSSSAIDTARSVLASLKAKYRYLDGVTVTIGKTPGGYQAVSYYTRGAIVISPTHTATITRILKHEIWHIIDWRDNGKIDWRESVPPHNAADYLK